MKPYKDDKLALAVSMALQPADVLELKNCLDDVHVYDQNRVFVIRKDADSVVRDYDIGSLGEGLLEKLDALKIDQSKNATVKIVFDMEKQPAFKISEALSSFSGKKVSDIHVFLSNKNAISFDFHKDNSDVLMFVLAGKKCVYVDEADIDEYVYPLRANEALFMPKGIRHSVTTLEDATVLLSIGLTE